MGEGTGRVPHIIRPNSSGALPQTWVVVDTETLPIRLDKTKWQHVFRLGVTATWRIGRESKPELLEMHRHGNASSLVAYLAHLPKGRERVGVTAHNLDYDAQVLDISTRLRDNGYRLTRAVIESGKWIQRWQMGTRVGGSGARSLLFVDLGNFFPIPLRELAIRLGMRKGKMPNFDAADEEWYSYCENDVRIELAALRAWIEFCKEHDLGYFSPTIAGQAFNAFRHRFMSHNIYVHVHSDVIAIERASYYGGRCQDFWRGRAPRVPYVHADTNSMYGSVMRENQFPVKQVGHFGPMSPRRLESVLAEYQALAIVEVETDVPAFPLRKGIKVHFPVGRFSTALASPELALAIEYGYLRSVSEVVTYESAPIFRDYADYFWNQRLHAKRIKDEWASKTNKAFLAALHGKFGQRIFTSELIMQGADREDEIWAEYDIEDSAWYEYRAIAGRVERRIREVSGRDTLIAIPAHVASYARVKLWRWIVEAGIENVFYCDTDSLIVNGQGWKRLAHHVEIDKLGSLRIIGKSNLLYIRAPKWYRFGSEVKRAGISFDARPVSFDQFEYDKFRRMRWSLSHQYGGACIVEEVKVNAPYAKLLTEHGIGHRLPWIRVNE